MRVVRLDFETISEADLRVVGGRNYAFHPSTQIVCACLREGDREAMVGQGWPAFPFPDLLPGTFHAVAHNATTFDKFIWRRAGWPEPIEWLDTAEWLRCAGHPRASLEWGAEYFLGRKKDAIGSDLLVDLNKQLAARSAETNLTFSFAPPGEVVLSELHKQRADTYVKDDVDNLDGLFKALVPWSKVDTETRRVDHIIMERGVAFDRKLAVRLLEVDAELAREARGDWTPPELRSVPQFTAHLARYGYTVPDCRKKTLQGVLRGLDESEPDQSMVGDLIRARLANTTIVAGKLRALLARGSPDDRLRDATLYCAAHTWRWAGKAFQPQNLPGGDLVPDMEAVIAGGCQGVTGMQVNTLARAVLWAGPGRVLISGDFKGIEPRVLAWVAGDEDAMDVFRSGKDPYIVLAAPLFGITYEDMFAGYNQDPKAPNYDAALYKLMKKYRQLGKAGEIGCGYQMSGEKMTTTAELMGVNWADLPDGVNGPALVEKWREIHWPTKQFWYDVQEAAMEACQGRQRVVGRVEFRKKGDHVSCILPSGRPIVYHRMSRVWWARRGNTMSSQMPDGTWQSYSVKPEDARRGGWGLVYFSRYGWQSTYGGKLTENIVQAIARDGLAHSLVLCENQGIPVVLHVHDSTVSEADENRADDIMKEVKLNMSSARMPDWTDGCPIEADVHYGARYD